VHCAISPGTRVKAACVLWPYDGSRQTLAVVYVGSAREARFSALGGLATLTRIAASAREFIEGWPREVP